MVRTAKSLPKSLLMTLLLSLVLPLAACRGGTEEETATPTLTPRPSATPAATRSATSTPPPSRTPTQVATSDATATADAPPEATQTPSSGLEAVIVSGDTASLGKPFSFDATQSKAGPAPIVTYEWDMGDGNTLYGAAVQHGYVAPGMYTVTLTITDADEQSDATTKAVEVIDATEATATATPTDDRPFTLVGTSWVMDNAVRGTTVTLVFDDGSLGGSSGCNSYSAGYTATTTDDANFSISVGTISATGETCTAEVMAQEKGYLDSLASASGLTVSGSTLTLQTGSGELTFTQSGGGD